MPRLTLPSAAGAFLAGLLLAPCAVRAQQNKSETVRFDTVDGVELKGTFWPSTKAKKGPVAILLHKVGGRSDEAGWKEMAEALYDAGFAVLAFDFRGHGASTGVTQQFWKHPMNAQVRRKAGPKLPETVSLADFPPRYAPNFVNDIAAAKQFIERRYNDQGECNCSNIVLIGAEDGATLGALWLASETKRYRILPVGLVGGQKAEQPESKDVVACVWLNMSNSIKGQPVSNVLHRWLKDAGNSKESKIPMAFIYGKDDTTNTTGANAALQLARSIRPNYDPKKPGVDTDELRGTVIFGIPGAKLVGSKLLTPPLETARKNVVDNYLKGFIFNEKKALNEWEKRDTVDNFYRWDFPMMRPIQAKIKNEKMLAPVPLQQLGLP